MTNEEIFSVHIAQKIANNLERVKGIHAVFAFELLGDSPESWVVDLTRESDFVYRGTTEKADCTVTIKPSDLADIVTKKTNPQMAFLTGKLKVKGNMGLALKLGSLL